MFNRSRRKIILSIMGSLILLFAVTLSVIMLASYHEIRQRNTEMLERFAERYSLDKPAGEPDGSKQKIKPDGPDEPDDNSRMGKHPMDERRDFQLSTFYSAALSEDGSVLKVDNGEKDLYSEEELVSLAKEILAGSQSSGRKGNLTYTVLKRQEYTLVAFMDTTVEESSMNTLLRYFLIIGGAAIAVLFFVSLILSRQIIRPLEENDRQQRQFISDSSHELKTPVAVISTNAELLSREIGENEWLANIQYENERMGELIRQLLDLSRAENTEVQMELVDFSRIVTGETLALEMLAFDKGKTIQSEIEDGIALSGNRNQLTQLTSILLDNAIRHSTGKEILLSLRRQGREAVLTVANEGTEIPREKLEHLFDRFYRVDEARNSEGQHYGLGLSIAKAVAEKHGGRIGVSCRNGKVEFTVAIPVRK